MGVAYKNRFSPYSLGVSSERRNSEIKRLNQTYLDVIASKKSLKESLEYMIATESYRWICNATYSLSPKPLRSQRSLRTKAEKKEVVADSVKKRSFR